MKLQQLPALSLILIAVSAGGTSGPSASPSARPQLSITIRDGNLSDMQGLDPVISWENSALLTNDVNVEYGIDLSARTTDLASLPKRVWGRASRVFAERFALAARLDAEVQSLERIDFEIDGEIEEEDLTMRVIGSMAASGFHRPTRHSARVTFLELKKGFDNDGNRVTISPRYHVGARRADVVATYDAGDTLIRLIAAPDDQAITISQRLNDENTISPTLDKDGKLSLAWDRKVGENNTVRTTLNPDRSVDVEWKDAAWTANVNFPMEGNDLSGATVHVKRDVKF